MVGNPNLRNWGDGDKPIIPGTALGILVLIVLFLAALPVTVWQLQKEVRAEGRAQGAADAVLYAELRGREVAESVFTVLVDSAKAGQGGVWLKDHGVVFFSVGVCSEP